MLQSLNFASSMYSNKFFVCDMPWLRCLGERGRLNVRRHFSMTGKVPMAQTPPKRVVIPGLDTVTYAERMHYVPGLMKSVYAPWERAYQDASHYRSPPARQMAPYKDKPCYVYNPRTNALEGVRQALWLTKSHLISGLPPQLDSLAKSPVCHLPDKDERVQLAIKHARFWDTRGERPSQGNFCNTLLLNLLNLCVTLESSHSSVRRRLFAEKYSLVASWKRGDDLFQVRGQNGILLSSMDLPPEVYGKKEVLTTANHILEPFYPVSPTIDLQKVHVYNKENCTGFTHDYAYPHAHSLYFLEGIDSNNRLGPDQFKAKMIMFAFGNALARAQTLFGTQHILEQPITIRAVGTNGRVFQFMVFQLNTTELSRDDGIKNQVWLDEDVELYDFAKVKPLIKKKQVKVPAGLAGYKPETFRRFLALYLHGAV